MGRKYFQSASDQRKEVYMTTVCYIILINKVADGETQPVIATKPHYSQWGKSYSDLFD